MHGLVPARRNAPATPLIAVDPRQLRRVLGKFGAATAAWVRSSGFRAEPGKVCLLPDSRGGLRAVLVGVARTDDLYALAGLPQSLPPGTYRLDASGLPLDAARAALGWGLGAYQYTRYRKATRAPSRLAVEAATLHGKSSNSPVLGRSLPGRIDLTLCRGQVAFDRATPPRLMSTGES